MTNIIGYANIKSELTKNGKEVTGWFFENKESRKKIRKGGETMNLEKTLLRLCLTFLGMGLFWAVIGGILAGFSFPLGPALFAVGIAFLNLSVVCLAVIENPKNKKETES